jgi:lipoprotein-releasing system ATP-binding protein
MEILLSAKNISKTFNKKRVLEKINIEISKAEIVAISGASGAGKTTLLNILSTLDKPDENNSSSLFIDNHEVFDLKKNDLANFRNQKIGFVFQFHELIPELNVIENICLPGWIKKDIDVKIKAKKLLEYFGLQDFADKKPLTLSGGEKQRVAIARSLINNPKIIFADEPTGNLDSKNSKILFDLFFKLRDDYDCSVVIVTHDENSANKCDRKLLIVDGKIKN